MKRIWTFCMMCVLIFACVNTVQVSANPITWPLGDTVVDIFALNEDIDIDDYAGQTWCSDEDWITYIFEADCTVNDEVQGQKTLKVDFILEAIPYPQGRGGNPGNPDSDSWTTGWVQFQKGVGQDQWFGDVDLALDWQDPPEETLVSVIVEIWENQGNPDIKTWEIMSFWLTYIDLCLGESAATVNITTESADVPDHDNWIMYPQDSWEVWALLDVEDNCNPGNTRDIHLEFSILVIDYPQGKTGDPGDVIDEAIWYLPNETGYVEFNGSQDYEDVNISVSLDVGPDPPQEYYVFILLTFWESGLPPLYEDETEFWISEGT